jgi:hypothetical protein
MIYVEPDSPHQRSATLPNRILLVKLAHLFKGLSGVVDDINFEP